MLTRRAATAPILEGRSVDRSVTTRRRLIAEGWAPARITAHLDAGHWRRYGRAVVLHNGPLDALQTRELALVNCGPRAMLTSFTALQVHGLRTWERDAVHVLVPAGARVVRLPQYQLRVHWAGAWPHTGDDRRIDTVASSLVRAAGSFDRARPACGLLAAAVQQRLIRATDLAAAVDAAHRVRHRAVLRAAVADMAQGAHALSEIDFAHLCRRFGLPEPRRQTVRRDSSGRRRYLDVEWIRADGRRVVVEIDGALHLAARRWWDDQPRQNDLTLAGDLVLRFPSAVVRTEPHLVIEQVLRALTVTPAA